MTWLGIDVGGANLKAADGCGWARSVAFPLWRDPAGLAGAIAALIESGPGAERIAVTMTGELCDAFRTKAEGVRSILMAMQQAAAGREVSVYLVNGQFTTVDEALRVPGLAAASNWHALAAFACRFVRGDYGLLIDVGSTTTDIIPLIEGRPRATGLNDTDRLLAGELVYTGIRRTPVCAITHTLPWRGKCCPVAAELFATAADAYVLLDKLPEESTAGTADGRPLTKEFARERLARMICADSSDFSGEDAHRAAAALYEAQSGQVRESIGHVLRAMPRSPEWVIVSGAGEFLGIEAVRPLLPQTGVIRLSERMGEGPSQAAPAHALAVLAGERT